MGEIKWLVGFFEGEGTIGISRGWKRAAGIVSMRVGNCDKELVLEYRNRWGGRIRVNNRKRPVNWRACYVWEASARKIIKPLLEMLPYFKSSRNRRRAELALAIQRLKEGWSKVGRHTPQMGEDHREKLLPLFTELRGLNRKGVAE